MATPVEDAGPVTIITEEPAPQKPHEEEKKPEEKKPEEKKPEEKKPATPPKIQEPAKTTDGVDLDFDKQLRQNLNLYIPLLILSLLITGAGLGLSTQAALDIINQAANDTELLHQLQDGTVPKSNFFLIGTIVGGFGIFVIMVVTVMFLDRRERIVNRRKIIEEEARLQKLKAKPKNIFDVLLSAARGNKSPQPAAPAAKK